MAGVVSCHVCGRRNRVPSAASGVPRCASCHALPPWVVAAGDPDFVSSATASVLVLVDLWAPWCGPCRQLSPAVESLAADLAGRLKVVKVDVDQAPKTAARFAVQSVPTLLLIRHGHVVDRQVGALAADALRRWVTAALSADR